MNRAAFLFGVLAVAACVQENPDAPQIDDASDATGVGGATVAVAVGSSGGAHGCFSTETTCGDKCVDVMTNADHCGSCGNRCGDGQGTMGACVEGECQTSCAEGFAEHGGECGNFFGAHETFPTECAGCQVELPGEGCSCPAGAALGLHVQSDCPGMPLRSPAQLSLCMTSGVVPGGDFGGAYQVDDAPDWCGADMGCRVGNPMAGGACACPDGFSPRAYRSIIRLPCGGEAGTRIMLCENDAAPITTFGGAYQFDDFDPRCRVPNGRTGECSCPGGTIDRTYRIMVDGAMGLYGSTFHLCLP